MRWPSSERSQRSSPRNRNPWHKLADWLKGTGDKDGASAAYKKAAEGHERAVAKYPLERNHWNTFAIARRNIGGDAAALAVWRRAAEENPEADWAWSKLADHLHDAKDYKGAVAACRKAVVDQWPATRRRALSLLSGCLAEHRNNLRRDSNKRRNDTHTDLQWCLNDPDFRGVRFPLYLWRLPADERNDWLKLWTDVVRLYDETAPKPATAPQ